MGRKKQAYKLNRVVTPQECPWLKTYYEIGEIVFNAVPLIE